MVDLGEHGEVPYWAVWALPVQWEHWPVENPEAIDQEAVYERLVAPLRQARAALLALPEPKDFLLHDFAQARADEIPETSFEDALAYRERFVYQAAAMFAGDPYGQPGDVAMVYRTHLLEPMRQVSRLLDETLGDATVPEKLEFFGYVGRRRQALPEEGSINVAINLMIASMVPGSNMNY